MSWVKSSRSQQNGQCVEVWRKSTRSGYTDCVEVNFVKSTKSVGGETVGGECVEVGCCHHGVLVRDSKDPDGPRLTFDPVAWSSFVEWLPCLTSS